MVARPGDHTYLFEWLEAFTAPFTEWIDEKGRQHRYRWKNNVPLHGDKNAIEVNFFEYTLTNAAGKVTYRNSWVTGRKFSEHNIQKMTQAGCCRWKIENKCFNTLKNQGYHIEHNYGHGRNT